MSQTRTGHILNTSCTCPVHVPNTYQTRPKHVLYTSRTRLVHVPDKLPYMSQMSCKVARRLVYILDEFQCGMTSMFFVKGKTRCGREEYAHLKSYRTSRFHIHLSHTHACTHTKKRTHFTSLLKATNGPDSPQTPENGSRQMTYKHTHMLALKTVPQKGLWIWRGWWREKKTRKERKQFFNTHVWASIVQGRESTD